ncbi:hypothetical protein NDU88_003908 [Pleurodeles waltl]|uniref:Uncharacterized protein n=1 Tax=Pleurodeles waltl TaxID=8319 RepID=A0AAV7W8U9_PLEWA|nr:hypothetical protein NDU88_003908 [Pleurodeles waltl]
MTAISRAGEYGGPTPVLFEHRFQHFIVTLHSILSLMRAIFLPAILAANRAVSITPSAPRGLSSARARAAPLRHPPHMVYLSRHSLISAHRGLPGFAVRYSFRFFSVCQGPGLHLQSSGPAACPLIASPPRRRLAPSPSWPRTGPTLSERGDSSGVPRCPRADRPRAASARSPARGHNLLRGSPPVFLGGRPPPEAPLRRTPTGRVFTWAPGPPLASPRSRGDSSRVPRCFWAVRPHAASGRGPTQGRGFGRAPRPPALDLADRPIPPPAPSGVATGALSRPATSVSSAPPLGP